MDVKKEVEAIGAYKRKRNISCKKNLVKAEHILRRDDKTFHSSGKLFRHRKENIHRLQEVLENHKTHQPCPTLSCKYI